MEFLIQHNLMNEEQLANVKLAVQNYPHQFVGVIPFSHEITSDRELIGKDFIPYGSTLFTTLALKRNWKGLHFNLENFSMKQAINNRHDMLNEELIVSVEYAETYLRSFNQNVFIRPDLDLKHFSGQVMNSIECADWLKDAMSCPPESGTYAIPADMLVVIASPKSIKAEWRWFIVDGQIVDGAMYKNRGQLVRIRETDNDVISEAQAFADKWLPSPCCVMDLALVDDELKVIEFNCINSSGFYGHDISKIFKALYEYSKN